MGGRLAMGIDMGTPKVRMMKSARLDDGGEIRCWNCGSRGLIAARSLSLGMR